MCALWANKTIFIRKYLRTNPLKRHVIFYSFQMEKFPPKQKQSTLSFISCKNFAAICVDCLCKSSDSTTTVEISMHRICTSLRLERYGISLKSLFVGLSYTSLRHANQNKTIIPITNSHAIASAVGYSSNFLVYNGIV